MSPNSKSYSLAPLQQALQKLPSWDEYFRNTERFGMGEGSENGFRAAEDVIPERLFRRQGEIWPKTVEAIQRHKAEFQFLAHGDVHLKNWYVANGDVMGITDWQCCSRGHWARDVAYTIATALSVDDRRPWERELIAYYVDCLAKAGGPVLAVEKAFDDYRGQLIAALPWWTVTLTPPEGLPDMQPRDTTLEFIKRIATAIDDLDGLDVE